MSTDHFALYDRHASAAGKRRSAHGGEVRSDLDDPLMGMPEPARNLVQAAKRIILREGIGGLTLNAVARESGENKAATAYYFGNKEGLIAAVHDSVVHDEYIESVLRFDSVTEGERIAQIIEAMTRISALGDEGRVAYELTPHALRSDALSSRLRELYGWYREVKQGWLQPWDESIEPDTMRGLLELLAAVIDGLSIQNMLDCEGFDISRPYRVLETILRISLPELARQEASERGPGETSWPKLHT